VVRASLTYLETCARTQWYQNNAKKQGLVDIVNESDGVELDGPVAVEHFGVRSPLASCSRAALTSSHAHRTAPSSRSR